LRLRNTLTTLRKLKKRRKVDMRFYIFDTSNLFHRAFWGNDRLATSDGFPTQGLHGFIQIVNGLMRDHKPDLVAFAMEGGESLRKVMDPQYKANRQELPDDLKLQLKMLPELMNAMGYPAFKSSGYEADDIIATLARLGESMDLDVVIVSSDKDFCQLVSDKVLIYNIAKEQMVDANAVVLKYGISPTQFLDYLSIVGDTSDNIKGVQGIGPKGAVDLLSSYGTLDNIYLNVKTIKGSKQGKLLASRDDVYKAKSLINFMPVNLQLDLLKDCVYNGPRRDELRSLFRKLEFRELEIALLGAAEVINVDGTDIGVRK